MALHDNDQNWEDVQDASLHYLEHAIVFNKLAKDGKLNTDFEFDQPRNEEEEQEIPPPADIKREEKFAKGGYVSGFRSLFILYSIEC